MKEIPGITEFLRDYPLMGLRPRKGKPPVLCGRFEFAAEHPSGITIRDAFELEIEIPDGFPNEVPTVREAGSRIPRNGLFHINSGDDTLCLGSPLSLLLALASEPSIDGFATRCIIPYLFTVSHKLSHGGPFLFGELDHGSAGELDDYVNLFGLKTRGQAIETLEVLGLKKRLANKRPCPCGCGVRLGRCKFNLVIRRFRDLASRSWYRARFNRGT